MTRAQCFTFKRTYVRYSTFDTMICHIYQIKTCQSKTNVTFSSLGKLFRFFFYFWINCPLNIGNSLKNQKYSAMEYLSRELFTNHVPCVKYKPLFFDGRPQNWHSYRIIIVFFTYSVLWWLVCILILFYLPKLSIKKLFYFLGALFLKSF